MTPVEVWTSSGAGIATLAAICGPALNGFYVRGRLDAHAKASADKLEQFGKKIDALESARVVDGRHQGEQSVLNANAAAAAIEARTARELSLQTEARQSAHERGCDQRQILIESHFDKTDQRLDHLAAEIRNLAFGIANNVEHLPATKRGQSA